MEISQEEAKLMLEAFGFVQSEGQMSEKDLQLTTRILDTFPELDKDYSYLRKQFC